ncbi:hypothetical protein [Oceanobacillus sp. FSL H7-0719]|uniref:hypothetical protein n=1 Tax=Oceanobacillus sp. FSL H7-0719 TaxID=2954507 RepID=UPI00325560F0
MAEIFNFPNEDGNADEHHEGCCDACQVIDEYLEIALECESADELRGVLRGLYDDAHLEGFKTALHNDVSMKIDILNDIDNEIR